MPDPGQPVQRADEVPGQSSLVCPVCKEVNSVIVHPSRDALLLVLSFTEDDIRQVFNVIDEHRLSDKFLPQQP
jgi:hypothetical protein